jgi:hypothetical protein
MLKEQTERQRFKSSYPDCLDLECTEECDHLEAHCARIQEVFDRVNRENGVSTT